MHIKHSSPRFRIRAPLGGRLRLAQVRRLHGLHQFMTEIYVLDIHHSSSFEMCKSVAVYRNHKWPGSVIELLKIVDLLTNSAARGGSAVYGFRVVIPSFPGHGFSDKATTTITDQW
jgi:pimeloyl-ACP methyl ester carboxylesterase